ncbi:MAG: response regulator transcription factor [Bryobacteraceae bacterium]
MGQAARQDDPDDAFGGPLGAVDAAGGRQHRAGAGGGSEQLREGPIRILAIDDHPMIRAGLAATIGAEADMAVAASAANGREGLALYRRLAPDVTPMDLKMPDMGGVEAIGAIRAEFPGARIIVLSTYQGDEDIYRALEAGAVTYLLKDMVADKMIGVIREVAAGGASDSAGGGAEADGAHVSDAVGAARGPAGAETQAGFLEHTLVAL